jgi:SPP1 family predicted phage head-tail adaptor
MQVGEYRHRVVFQNPVSVPDGVGGFLQSWTDLAPASWMVAIEPATAADLERIAAGTTLSTASHVVTGRFHPGVTTQTRMIFNGQFFSITGVVNVELRSITMICGAVQVVA